MDMMSSNGSETASSSSSGAAVLRQEAQRGGELRVQAAAHVLHVGLVPRPPSEEEEEVDALGQVEADGIGNGGIGGPSPSSAPCSGNTNSAAAGDVSSEIIKAIKAKHDKFSLCDGGCDDQPQPRQQPRQQAERSNSKSATKKDHAASGRDDDEKKKGGDKEEDREKLLLLLQVASDSPDEDDDSVKSDDDDDDDDDNNNNNSVKDDIDEKAASRAGKRKRKEKASGGTCIIKNGTADCQDNRALAAKDATTLTATATATATAAAKAKTIAPAVAVGLPTTTGALPIPITFNAPNHSTTASTTSTNTSSGPKKRRRKAVPRKPTFAQKLMTILADPECQEAIKWMPDGQSFVIGNPDVFGPIVMGRYFGNKSAKFESFTRKLNRWGFKRITARGPGTAVAFCHHLFQRDDPDLCTKMKGDGGLRATDEERQAAAAAGIDPRRAQGLGGMTPAQIAQRQAELDKEREMRKAGLADPPYKKKKVGSRDATSVVAPVGSTAPIPAGVRSTAAGGTATVPGASVGPAPIAAAAPSMPGAKAIAGAPVTPGVVSQAANVAARELVGELEHLRRIREEKGRLQAQVALAAAAYSATSAGGSPFLRPTATGAVAAGAGVFPGGMPGVLPPSVPPPRPSQSSTSLLEQQLRLQQQLEIEHERLYLERIKQERQLEEQRLRALQQHQQQQLRAASAMSSPVLSALPPGGVHHNPALALAVSSGLITHPLGPPAPVGTPNDWSAGSYTDALNNYYDARTRLIAAKFNAEDGEAETSGGPLNPPDPSARGDSRKEGTEE